MPVYIGDYLADTMHLSTEQHGAYLLLLFHLWRRGVLHDDDVVLAKITGLDKSAWSRARLVLAEFFEIHDGLWHHGRVERERIRVAAKQQSKANKAKLAASSRWSKQPSSAHNGRGGRCFKHCFKQCFKHCLRYAWRCQVRTRTRTRVSKSIYFPKVNLRRNVVLIHGILPFEHSWASTGRQRTMHPLRCPGRDGMPKRSVTFLRPARS